MPHSTHIGHFGGGLHSQSLDWYWQTKQYRKIQINKLNTNQKKETTWNTATQNYPGSVASYNTWPGNEVGLFYNAPEPIRGVPVKQHPTISWIIESRWTNWILFGTQNFTKFDKWLCTCLPHLKNDNTLSCEMQNRFSWRKSTNCRCGWHLYYAVSLQLECTPDHILNSQESAVNSFSLVKN